MLIYLFSYYANHKVGGGLEINFMLSVNWFYPIKMKYLLLLLL